MGYFNDSIRWQQQIADQMSGLKMSGVLDLVQNTVYSESTRNSTESAVRFPKYDKKTGTVYGKP